MFFTLIKSEATRFDLHEKKNIELIHRCTFMADISADIYGDVWKHGCHTL